MIMIENKEELIMEKRDSDEQSPGEDNEVQKERPSTSKFEVFEDIDEALVKMGGFSKFQWFSFSIIVTGMAAGAFILYNLYYFEKEPAYECQYYIG